MVFGQRTEKHRSARREEGKEAAEAEQGEEAKTGSEKSGESSSARKLIIKGHWRKAASAYSGAKVVICRHPEYQAGDRCPNPFCDGHLYQINPPNSSIQFTGRPLIEATKYCCEVLRCWDCQTRYEAPLPEGVTEEKYEATCDATIALMKYAGGLPWYRQARLQWTVPIPGTTKLHRLEENIGAVAVELASDDLREIDSAASNILVQGYRYPEELQRMTGR
jgi:transposase